MVTPAGHLDCQDSRQHPYLRPPDDTADRFDGFVSPHGPDGILVFKVVLCCIPPAVENSCIRLFLQLFIMLCIINMFLQRGSEGIQQRGVGATLILRVYLPLGGLLCLEIVATRINLAVMLMGSIHGVCAFQMKLPSSLVLLDWYPFLRTSHRRMLFHLVRSPRLVWIHLVLFLLLLRRWKLFFVAARNGG